MRNVVIISGQSQTFNALNSSNLRGAAGVVLPYLLGNIGQSRAVFIICLKLIRSRAVNICGEDQYD